MAKLNFCRLVKAWAILAGIGLCHVPALCRGADTDIIDVPLYYDVLGGADLQVPQGKTVQSELRKLTKLINNLFEGSKGLNLQFATEDEGIRMLGGDTSKLDDKRRAEILKDGAERLKDDKGDKGLLIVLAQQAVSGDATVLGICIQDKPVGIVTARSVAGIDDTAAHEIGHSLTLGHYMVDRDNLMWKDTGNISTKLVADQIATLRKAAAVRGKVKMKAMLNTPTENKPQAFGMNFDPGQLLAGGL